MTNKELTRKATRPAPAGLFDWPGGHFGGLQQRMNRLFDDFHGDFGGFAPSERLSELSPRIDVEEKPEAYLISAELPGAEEDDIEIKVAENMLTIQGEKKTSEEREENNMHLTERSYGSFRRSFRLPPDTDTEKISASFDKGVLHLTVPKPEEKANPVKKIAISGS
ncbi:MAG: Hsp20/alpha crystallin family protein [Alphaproteobacteria bacterium]|jgi:HSP20 family protein|nr:Hsp20/alpha crystallin family protein [Alphaproteobacteria bacterium]MDP6566117.1 Hsp20/alpha crystallin family protein [Alphaproteobacteria bacterium]MDP6813775.1 Hsp20/alpha crystallin family protein [Alphaproteobacteria bacterium]